MQLYFDNKIWWEQTDRQTDRHGKQKNNDKRIENNNNKWRDT